MKESLKLLDQIMEKAMFDDEEHKKEMIAKHKASKTVGESWMIFHLKKLKELIQKEGHEQK